MRPLLLLVFLTSCTWGHGEYFGWDAKAREESAREIHETVEEIKQVPELPAAIEEKLDHIQERAADDARRARIIEQYFEPYVPKEVVLGSEKDESMVQAGAGLAHTVGIRRKKLKSLPGRIIAGVAKRIIPRPIWITAKIAIYVLAFMFIGSTGFAAIMWMRRNFWHKATSEAIERFNRLPEAERKALLSSAHTLGRAFEKNGE